jgi:hypothetical protein
MHLEHVFGDIHTHRHTIHSDPPVCLENSYFSTWAYRCRWPVRIHLPLLSRSRVGRVHFNSSAPRGSIAVALSSDCHHRFKSPSQPVIRCPTKRACHAHRFAGLVDPRMQDVLRNVASGYPVDFQVGRSRRCKATFCGPVCSQIAGSEPLQGH